MSDRQFLWRVVSRNFETQRAHAPGGFEPLVEVFVGGREAPIPIGVVETHREHPWVLLHSITEGRDELDVAYPSDRYVFVHEAHVASVEIRFVRKGAVPIGFRWSQAADDTSAE
jgi:hypothetical protein